MPPNTDLEDLVRHLSGRGAKARAGVSPLDDLTGDATQVLDEIRRRTRSLLDDPADPNRSEATEEGWAGPISARSVTAAPSARSRGVLPGLALVLLGVGAALAADRAWRSLDGSRGARASDPEVRQALAEIRAHLAAPPAPVPVPASDPALADLGSRLDARFAALDARLDRLDRLGDRPERPTEADAPRPPAVPDPALAAMVADLAAIRREQTSSEAATARQVQEMRTILQQVNTEVRRVLSRPEPSQSAAIAPVLALAVQALIHNLQHPSAQVRGEAVEQLARLGPTARTAIPALRDRFARESDQNVRTAIETALSILTSN